MDPLDRFEMTLRKKAPRRIYLAVGQCVVNFGYIESGIDLCIAFIHEDYGGKNIALELPKTAFSRKLEYFKKAIKNLPNIPFPNEANKMVVLCEQVSKQRNAILHSQIEIFPQKDLDVHLLRKFEIGLSLVTAEISLKKLFELNKLIVALALQIGNYLDCLKSGLVRPNKHDNPVG